MKYGRIEGVNKPVSRVFYGTGHRVILGVRTDEDRQEAFRVLDAALANGINTFDMAHIYGEETFGEWLRDRDNRDKVVIVTKGAHFNPWRRRVTPYDIESDLMDSLAKLHTDHIDVWMMHRDNEAVPVSVIMDTLGRLSRDGAIDAIGVSNWTTARIAEANRYAAEHDLAPIRVSSPYYGLAEEMEDPYGDNCQSVAGPGAADARAFYRTRGMPVIAYAALAAGLFDGRVCDQASATARLSPNMARAFVTDDNLERVARARELAKQKNVSVPTIALAYVISRGEMDVFPVVSTGNTEHLAANAAAAELTLTKEECDWLDLTSR